MTGRERMMIALENGRPDRLPCQVHGWMDCYLKEYLGGRDWYEAYEMFDMDLAIYVSPRYEYNEKSLADWRVETVECGMDADGNERREEIIHTPRGTLRRARARNAITEWDTECLIKTPDDFALWEAYAPVPVAADFTEIQAARDRIGDRGIVRSHPFSPGQGSPWQSFCMLAGMEETIMRTFDDPDFVHHALDVILERTLRVTALWKGTPADMVETGGGAGSSTVISPALHEEFCLPYDRRQHEAFRDVGVKTVYHLCGGLMPLLEIVARNGADGLETMTPPGMGGDCDLAEASRRVGDRLFFIGGFDQSAGFERGDPETARRLVLECFEATRDHAGYICAPSDHFFHGDPANVRAFADACRECAY